MLARYLTQSSTTSESKNQATRSEFIKRLRSLIPKYTLYNGLAITAMLTKLHEIVDSGAVGDLGEDLNLEDEE